MTNVSYSKLKEQPLQPNQKDLLPISKSDPSKERTSHSSSSELLFGFIPKDDAGNILLLVCLYLLQGVPFGLAYGALPFLLKPKLSYSDMAVFSFAGYPYSLKLFWSPLVDSKYNEKIGRRKTWIIPMQLLTGLMFFLLRNYMNNLLITDSIEIYSFTAIWFFVILLCATQDIAVDGWALTLLSKKNVQFASTCQTIGVNTGYFLSFTVFLALNSAEFCNKYLRSVPSSDGLIGLGSYLTFWSFIYLALTFFITFFKKETSAEDEEKVSLKSAYFTMAKIIKLPHMLQFIFVLLVSKVAFICNESVTALKLLEKGIQKEDLGLAVLIDFPFQILFGYFAAQWSSGKRPLKPWLYAFYGRLLFAAIGMIVVHMAPPSGAIGLGYFSLVILTTVLSSFMSTVQFVSLGAFFSYVADPLIGGTYITLLNTCSNFGGTWPRYFILEAVEYFTKSECSTTKLPCSKEQDQMACTKANGVCSMERDGYYTVGILSVIVGLLILLRIVYPKIRYIEQLPSKVWKIGKQY